MIFSDLKPGDIFLATPKAEGPLAYVVHKKLFIPVQDTKYKTIYNAITLEEGMPEYFSDDQPIVGLSRHHYH